MPITLAPYCDLPAEKAAEILALVAFRHDRLLKRADIGETLKSVGGQVADTAKDWGGKLLDPGSAGADAAPGWTIGRNALLGAGVGGLAGGAISMGQPKNRRSTLSSMLQGALLGGTAGGLGTAGYYGAQKYMEPGKDEAADLAAQAQRKATMDAASTAPSGIKTMGTDLQGANAALHVDPARHPGDAAMAVPNAVSQATGFERHPVSSVVGGGIGGYTGYRLGGALDNHLPGRSLQRLDGADIDPKVRGPLGKVQTAIEKRYPGGMGMPATQWPGAAAEEIGVSPSRYRAALSKLPTSLRSRALRWLGAAGGAYLGSHVPDMGASAMQTIGIR